MGRGFATALATSHVVVLGSRDPTRAGDVVRATGARDVRTARAATSRADVVILTVPWEAHEDTVAELGDLPSKVVVDVSFPYKKAIRERLLEKSSTGEELQKLLPKARVFKGWNHVHARHLTAPEVNGVPSSVLIAGDDREGKEVVFGLARDMGFDPVDAGPIRASRDLDRLVGIGLFVRLGPISVLSQRGGATV
jgi:predicted dinucleotide-binding enzyme